VKWETGLVIELVILAFYGGVVYQQMRTLRRDVRELSRQRKAQWDRHDAMVAREREHFTRVLILLSMIVGEGHESISQEIRDTLLQSAKDKNGDEQRRNL
jgi:hypothetical protein